MLKKSIQKKSFVEMNEYSVLQLLEAKQIKNLEKQDLYDQFRYNNDNQLARKVRRNEKMDDSVLLKQSQIFDLGELCLLSKIKVNDMKRASINMYVAEFRDGAYQKIMLKEKVLNGK